ncbi:hypothetical protein D7W82_21590 [Corallococcus sp. CA049B]|uniref:hypothetical protein n=1 Tax=Corallococcus sp. CA049B TaxID=2316730 RepID=UPI000EA25CAB|nr:hypothetical protein [Corallococcus sp. CA049B]RKG84735.1 hypothetical protein D7W82_21590 [Corallococcus sp. CA049B]
MTKINGSAPSSASRTSQSNSSNTAWQGQMNEKMKGTGLDKSRNEALQKKVSSHMEAFAKNHSPAETEAEFKKTWNKELGTQISDKISTDNFLRRLTNRRKELMSDLWE